MTEIQNTRRFDLEDRTRNFAIRVRFFVKTVPFSLSNREDVKQLVRSSGSIGANYIEANEALSRKDFVHRMKISRKEAKETIYWLRLIDKVNDQTVEDDCQSLVQECTEIMKIFGSIITKCETK